MGHPLSLSFCGIICSRDGLITQGSNRIRKEVVGFPGHLSVLDHGFLLCF